MGIENTNRNAIAIANAKNIMPDEALKIMHAAKVTLISDESIKSDTDAQVAMLTCHNILKRIFLGGINVLIPHNVENLTPLAGDDFRSLIEDKKTSINPKKTIYKKDIKITFGVPCLDENSYECISNGWQGGVNFYNNKRVQVNKSESNVYLGAMAAASIASFYATNKAFDVIENAFEINTGISLWNLEAGKDWHKKEYMGINEPCLPDSIWTLGLGHLGQAYLWTVGFLPFKSPKETTILLQDHDIVQEENIGSQLLSKYKDINLPKTRACCNFLEEIGFKTQIIEKAFQKEDLLQSWMQEYPIILNGVDNIETRRSITKDQVKLFLDGATNGSSDLFDSFTLKNVSHIDLEDEELWTGDDTSNAILHKNLYEKYEKGDMKCGELSNIGISTPYVGLFGALITVSEMLRALNKGNKYSIVSLRLRELYCINTVNEGEYNDDLLMHCV